MATAFTSSLPTPILASASSNHRKPDRIRPKASSSPSTWWTPLFGWPADPDYINPSKNDSGPSDPADSGTLVSRSRFTPGCFTEEKAKQLRRKTRETATFHDFMYHSPIASRLASDVSDPEDL